MYLIVSVLTALVISACGSPNYPSNSLSIELGSADQLANGNLENPTLHHSDSDDLLNAQPAKSCQTAGEIEEHIESGIKKLIVDGQPIPDINEQFCLHTVVVGSRSLAGGGYIFNGPKSGFPVLIANVSGITFGANAFEARKACSAITILGKKWIAPLMFDDEAMPRETNIRRSFETLGAYFKGDSARSYWSGSHNRGAYSYIWDGSNQLITISSSPTKTTGVRCIPSESF